MAPVNHATRVANFGKFDWKWSGSVTDPEAVTIERVWREANIVKATLPGMDRHVWLHREAVKPFTLWLTACEENGLRDNLVVCAGAWVPRFKRQNGNLHERMVKSKALGEALNSAKLSDHAWGSAIDFDAAHYPLGKPVPKSDVRWELAELALSFGIGWGGVFQTRPDGMHWEITDLRGWSGQVYYTT